jgi:hypothetical protein
MIRFAAFLRDEKEQAPRSAYNKFENVMTVPQAPRHHGQVTQDQIARLAPIHRGRAEIYEQETLDKLFAECDADELLLFEFFQMSGMREQEIIYATDRCLDFSANTVSVRHNPEVRLDAEDVQGTHYPGSGFAHGEAQEDAGLTGAKAVCCFQP